MATNTQSESNQVTAYWNTFDLTLALLSCWQTLIPLVYEEVAYFGTILLRKLPHTMWSYNVCRALRRKVGGTAKDYWKDWVDVKGQYADKGYVSKESTPVPGLAFLLVVVVGVFVALGVVVSQT